jgi:DNA transformation protein
MSVQPQYLDYILEQLAALGALRWRRMFGAVGLYSNDLFFGLIDDDTLFFKADARNLDDYVMRNMPRFMPDPARPAATLGYYQVPADVIEDDEALLIWARKAVEVALASQARKTRAPKKRASKKRASKKKAASGRAKRPRAAARPKKRAAAKPRRPK